MIEPGAPVKSAAEIIRWLARIDAGTFSPKEQLLPKAKPQETMHNVPLVPVP